MATADKKKLVRTFHVSIIAQGNVKGNLQLCKTAQEGNTLRYRIILSLLGKTSRIGT